MHNKMQVALQNASTAANVKNIMANTALTNAKASLINPGSKIMDALGEGVETGLETAQELKDIFQEYTGLDLSEFVSKTHKKKMKTESRLGSRDPRVPSYYGRKDSSEHWKPRYNPNFLKKIRIKYPEKAQKYQYQKWRN